MKFKIGSLAFELRGVNELPARGRLTRSQRLSPAPWWGFSPHDQPRSAPLPECPSARCGRARKCLAAIDGLYCLRTHHDKFQQQWLRRHHPLARQIAAIAKVKDKRDHRAIARRAEAVMDLRRAYEAMMQKRWKAGALDHLYGKYNPKGALLKPPPRDYAGFKSGECRARPAPPPAPSRRRRSGSG